VLQDALGFRGASCVVSCHVGFVLEVESIGTERIRGGLTFSVLSRVLLYSSGLGEATTVGNSPQCRQTLESMSSTFSSLADYDERLILLHQGLSYVTNDISLYLPLDRSFYVMYIRHSVGT